RFLNDGRVHRVNDGETLYSIAWMYDLDYLALATHNGIGPPYTIYHDQFLRVDLRPGAAPRTAAPTAVAANAPSSRAPQTVTISPVTITRSSDTRTASPLPESPTASMARTPSPPVEASPPPVRTPLPEPVVSRQPV